MEGGGPPSHPRSLTALFRRQWRECALIVLRFLLFLLLQLLFAELASSSSALILSYPLVDSLASTSCCWLLIGLTWAASAVCGGTWAWACARCRAAWVRITSATSARGEGEAADFSQTSTTSSTSTSTTNTTNHTQTTRKEEEETLIVGDGGAGAGAAAAAAPPPTTITDDPAGEESLWGRIQTRLCPRNTFLQDLTFRVPATAAAGMIGGPASQAAVVLGERGGTCNYYTTTLEDDEDVSDWAMAGTHHHHHHEEEEEDHDHDDGRRHSSSAVSATGMRYSARSLRRASTVGYGPTPRLLMRATAASFLRLAGGRGGGETAEELPSIFSIDAFPWAVWSCMQTCGLALFVIAYCINGMFWLPQYALLFTVLYLLLCDPQRRAPPSRFHSGACTRPGEEAEIERYNFQHYFQDVRRYSVCVAADHAAAIAVAEAAVCVDAPPTPPPAPPPDGRGGRRKGSRAALLGTWGLAAVAVLLLVDRLVGSSALLVGALVMRNLWLGVLVPVGVVVMLHHSSKRPRVSRLRAEAVLSFGIPSLLMLSITYLSLYLPAQECSFFLERLPHSLSSSSSSSGAAPAPPAEGLPRARGLVQEFLLQNSALDPTAPPTPPDFNFLSHPTKQPPHAADAEGGVVVRTILSSETVLFLVNATRVYYNFLGTPSAYLGMAAVPIPSTGVAILCSLLAPSLLWVCMLIIMGAALHTPSRAGTTMAVYILSLLVRRMTEGGVSMGLLAALSLLVLSLFLILLPELRIIDEVQRQKEATDRLLTLYSTPLGPSSPATAAAAVAPPPPV
jgi:hypothetical protein